jgi:hypothetical protein
MVKTRYFALGALGLIWLITSCRPDIEERPSLIQSDRLLAISSTPAEATPAASVTYQALFVGVDGPVDSADLNWALCTARKPLAKSGPISDLCLASNADLLTDIGSGETVTGALPRDVCQLFGPSPPPAKQDEPASRAADPDTTGGYYQPVRVLARVPGEPEKYSVGATRLICGLGGATQKQSAEYNKNFRPNENPKFTALGVRRAAGKVELTIPPDEPSPTVSVKPGETVTLRAHWATCPLKPVCGDGICGAGENDPDPTKGCLEDCTPAADCTEDCAPKGCTGSEPYQYFDPLQRTLINRREAIRVSWFANDGRFDHERTGRAEAEGDMTFSDNAWTAPNKPTTVLLWAVIRDDRGGVGFASHTLAVKR